MTNPLTRNGATMRVATAVPLGARLVVLPLVGGAVYMFYLLFFVLKEVATGLTPQREALPGELVLSLFGLAIGALGLAALLGRAYLTIDKERGQLARVNQFGPLKFARAGELSSIEKVTITSEETGKGSFLYSVNLCSGRGTQPMLAATFNTLAQSTELANELGRDLRLPVLDLCGAEPDED